MFVQIQETASQFQIRFDYHPALVAKVKEFPRRRFDPVEKMWLVPIGDADMVRRFARETNAKWGAEVLTDEEADFTSPEMPELTEEVPLKMELFHYQKQGVAYALDKKRLIIGDQPGLGKTAQAIATIEKAGAFPCLIICPSSLKINWQREVAMWTHNKALILSDQIKHNFHYYWQAGAAKYFIVNFESLKKYFVESIDTPKGKKLRLDHIKFKGNINLFKSVIIDEAHRVKSTATQQTKFTKGITKGKEYIIALTGTPVINKPKDLLSQLGIIDRMIDMGGYQNFVNRYCSGPREASNLKELNYRLNTTCFYRREKSLVMKDLPPKTRQVVICDIDTRKEYADAERDLENYLRQYKDATDQQIARSMRGEIMVRIGILKNISARGKLKPLFEHINDVLETGEKLVVFGHLKEVLGKIKAEYPHAVSITGDDNQLERQQAVDAFQKNPGTKLIICSAKAAGVGLTLTAASRVTFVELPWTFADCEQAEDRCHRVGQRDNVTCTYLLGSNTIDQKIYKLIIEKKTIAAEITGATDEVEENVISQLIDLFNQPAL